MRIKYPKILIIISAQIFLFLQISCSGVSTSKLPESYLSPEYEDKSFENVSIDVCYPILNTNMISGYDTLFIPDMKHFDKAFKEYFLQGIRTFSSVTKTGWIFYEEKYPSKIIKYCRKTRDSLDFNVYLPDSLSFFQEQSNSDFLLIMHSSSIIQSPPGKSNQRSRYSTKLNLEYSIWYRKTGDLVAKDKVTSKMEFDKLVGKWPYRGVIMKTAALIFEKLPMFQK